MRHRDNFQTKRVFRTYLGLVLGVWGVMSLGMTVGWAAQPLRIVAFGDSLTAGYLLANGEAFPDILQKALQERGLSVTISNAGVSGDTTTGGLARLDWSVPDGTDVVLLELGANDMLRGTDPKITFDNLDAMIRKLKARKIAVMLFGMRSWSNAGPDYAERFNKVYTDLAKSHQIPLYPFFLDGVTGVEGMVLPDALHPSARGVHEIVRRTLPEIEAFLRNLPVSR